jgi:hypothetical protein
LTAERVERRLAAVLAADGLVQPSHGDR